MILRESFNQAYRLFNEYALLVHSKGAMILKSLDDYIEALYSNWYLAELSRNWNEVLEAENRMQAWQIPGVPRQQNFFNEVVKPQFQNPQIKRVFVIISDALRYEVAEELGNQINTEKRFTAELRSQLGVLPSYTQLGMAALLPHEQLCYQPGTGPSDSWWQSGFLFCGTRSALTRHRHNHITPVFTFIFCLQRYHTMKIITRGEAMRIHRQHPASRLFPFCTGKYRWHGSAETYTGREVQDIPGVLAVFAERRKDSFSPYVRLMSVTLN